MKERVRFERRDTTTDADGSPRKAWAELWTCWAGYRPQFGGEKLKAGQFESTSRGNLTVRRCSESEAVTAGDRVVFVSGGYAGQTANIESIVNTPDRAFVEFLVTVGVAT
jgi:SPP1 family predicted phage head-tail adaptor